jgi:DNA-binding transcriptional LysR family regulator
MRADTSKDDWNDYRFFAAVARAGSFSAASKILGTTSQAVSSRVVQLEKRLGVRLLNRTTHGVTLTPDGERVSGRVLAAEEHLGRAAATTPDASNLIEGECRLALGDGMATYWFPQFIAGFARRHPRIALYPFASIARTASKGPHQDIQVQYTDTPDEDLVAQRVATLHFLLHASQDYLQHYGTPTTKEALAEHRFVDFTLTDSDRGTFASWTGMADRVMVVTNAIGVQGEAVRFGAGLGLLPSYASLVYPNLVPVMSGMRFAMPVYLCFERETAKRPAVRATLDFLREHVFDRARMPWFADDFAAPETHWPVLLEGSVKRSLSGEALNGLSVVLSREVAQNGDAGGR